MNRSELFNETKAWLETEQLAFNANEDEACFQVRMNVDAGLVQMRLICEEAPAAMQVICGFPMKVPKEKLSEAALLLHNLNLRLRIGAFYLVAEERLITF